MDRPADIEFGADASGHRFSCETDRPCPTCCMHRLGVSSLWLGTQRQMLAAHSRAVHVCVLTGKSSLAYRRFVGDVFKALADPTRRVILDELQERSGQTLFELCVRLTTKHRLGSSRQAISQHLAVLESAGLIVTHRQGRYKYHDLDTTPLRTIVERWQIGH